MKNILTFAAILLIISTQSYSQKNRDALFLRNGSQIFGKMEQVTGGKFSVRTTDGSLFVFDSTEVNYFVIRDNSTVARKKQGLGFGAEMGLLIGSQNSQYPAPFSLGLNGSYTFATKFMAEAGTGIEIIGHTFAPVYAGFRVCLNNRRTAPFIFARAGYMILLSESDNETYYYPERLIIYPIYYPEDREYKGGPSATAGYGISVAMSDVEFYMSFAYRYFRVKEIVTTTTPSTESYYYNFNRLEIKLGFRF